MKRESCGSTSVRLSLNNCVLDDLRTTLEREEEGEEGEEDDDEGSTRESSVDAVLELAEESAQPRIRRYTLILYL